MPVDKRNFDSVSPEVEKGARGSKPASGEAGLPFAVANISAAQQAADFTGK
jgi:hypothetical protein